VAHGLPATQFLIGRGIDMTILDDRWDAPPGLGSLRCCERREDGSGRGRMAKIFIRTAEIDDWQ